jgi:hypothetical protein
MSFHFIALHIRSLITANLVDTWSHFAVSYKWQWMSSTTISFLAARLSSCGKWCFTIHAAIFGRGTSGHTQMVPFSPLLSWTFSSHSLQYQCICLFSFSFFFLFFTFTYCFSHRAWLLSHFWIYKDIVVWWLPDLRPL